jgi:N-acyl-L-homoserine lactone synthetase
MRISANAANICTKQLEEYRGLDHFLASTPSQRNAIFKLRYEAYLEEGHIEEMKEARLPDEFDCLPGTYLYGISLDEKLIGSIRLNLISAERKASIVYETFPDYLDPIIDHGEKIVGVSRLAVRCQNKAERKDTILYTLKLADVFFKASNADLVAIVVRESHIPFYKRYGFDLVSEPRFYHETSTPLNLMVMDLRKSARDVASPSKFQPQEFGPAMALSTRN